MPTTVTNDSSSPSARFKDAVTSPHEVVFYAESLLNGSVIRPNLPIVDGSVHGDRNNLVRRTADVQIGDRSLIPSRASDPLAPYGQELRIKRGIRYANGDIEYLTIFLGGIQSAVWDAGLGAINVSCADRMQRLVDSKSYQPRSVANYWPGPNTVAGTVLLKEIIIIMYSHALIPIPESATLPIQFDSGLNLGLRTPKGMVVEEDPMQDVIVPMLKNWGAEMYAGTDGFCHVVPVPDARSAVPVYDCHSGEGGLLVSADAGLSREGTVNFVTVFSNQLNSETAPVWWTARDANPSSPTFGSSYLTINGEYSEAGAVSGPFGRQSMQIRSESAQTKEQCRAEAEATLRNNLGAVRSVSFSSVPATWVSPGQAIRVRYPGFNEQHIVDSLDIPLNETDALSGTTRSFTAALV